MMQTSFWSPDGKPMCATEFIERLFGDLPELFKNEDELCELWSTPDTRRKFLEGLGEKGYGKAQLSDLAEMVDAENHDLHDVLAYIAYTSPPLSRQERVAAHQDHIFSIYRDQQQEFLRFVLDQYIKEGVGELDDSKLPDLIELKYHGVADAVSVFGRITDIWDTFIGFQKHLYARQAAM